MHSPEEVIRQIKASGERLTLSRRLVIDAVCAAAGHVTVADLQAIIAAGGQHLPEPTIYRVLQWLKDLRVVSQTDTGAAGIVYERVTEPCHHHLICLDCGRTIDLGDTYFAGLRDTLRREYSFEPRIEHMAIFGRCAECTRPA